MPALGRRRRRAHLGRRGRAIWQIIDTWDGAETFDPDCRFDDIESAKLCYQHGELIGRITAAESREDGLHITARISDTQLGRDVVNLLKDGALDSLSVGFVPIEDERDKAGITHRRRVRLLETSVVSWPAYEAAKITGQRSETLTEEPTDNKESEDTKVDKELEETLDAIKDEQRSLKAALAKAAPPNRRNRSAASTAPPATTCRRSIAATKRRCS